MFCYKIQDGACSSLVERFTDNEEAEGPIPSTRTMDSYLIIFFLVGILQDLLATLNVRFIALHKIWPAVVSSFLTVVVAMLVLYNILSDLDAQRSIPAILAYAFGIAVGTFFAMKFKLESKE